MWEYAQAEHIARDYDEYFAHTRLFEFDEAVLARHFTRPGVIVDLGAGTGRALVPLARRGFHGVAVDLSTEMLEVIGEKAAEENLRIGRLRANLVELDCLADHVADYCVCLFSTLGMIRGGENRARAIAHARRILKPGGRFVLHVHNFWYNLRDPGGPWWVFKSLFRSLLVRDYEAGDKFFEYRQIPNMYLHVFRCGEVCRLLRRAGFDIVELIRLDPQRFRALRRPWLFGDLRANGWIVVCK
jgi:SAM-dependent methyltransferase